MHLSGREEQTHSSKKGKARLRPKRKTGKNDGESHNRMKKGRPGPEVRCDASLLFSEMLALARSVEIRFRTGNRERRRGGGVRPLHKKGTERGTRNGTMGKAWPL